jgi:hypothetical protein
MNTSTYNNYKEYWKKEGIYLGFAKIHGKHACIILYVVWKEAQQSALKQGDMIEKFHQFWNNYWYDMLCTPTINKVVRISALQVWCYSFILTRKRLITAHQIEKLL